MSPQAQSFAKVGINFAATFIAVFAAIEANRAYGNWRAARAAKGSAPAPAPAPAGK